MWGDNSLWVWFAFPWWLLTLSTFSCICWPFLCLLCSYPKKKNVNLGPCPVFKLDYLGFWFSFCYWVVWGPCIFWILTPYQVMWFVNIFPHYRSLPSHFIDGFLCWAELFSFDVDLLVGLFVFLVLPLLLVS